MIPFIDNIGYTGPNPNFSRDAMTWTEMQAVTEQTLDKGHIVYCKSADTEDKVGHYVFGGIVSNSPVWTKLTEKDGSVSGGATPIPEETILALSDELVEED